MSLPRLNPVEPPWYGPVRPVVGEGWHREVPPYPDQPRFPPTGVSAVSAVFGGRDHIRIPIVIRIPIAPHWRLNEAGLLHTHAREVPFSTCRESPPEICDVLILGRRGSWFREFPRVNC
jgi:hypothetical protein